MKRPITFAGPGGRARRMWRLTAVASALAVLAGASAIAAFGHGARSTAAIVGNPTAGKSQFSSTCAACHTLAAAKSVGTIGPNLDKVPLPEATLIKAITNGGATVMTKAAASKYTTQMQAYKGQLSTAQIDDIAAFVYVSTHAAVTPKPSVTSFVPASGKIGAKVTIKGKNLTGATAVKFGKLKAKFKVASATKITATVPSKAKTGKVSVTTKGGTSTSPKSFVVK